jgi:hypothetical protein
VRMLASRVRKNVCLDPLMQHRSGDMGSFRARPSRLQAVALSIGTGVAFDSCCACLNTSISRSPQSLLVQAFVEDDQHLDASNATEKFNGSSYTSAFARSECRLAPLLECSARTTAFDPPMHRLSSTAFHAPTPVSSLLVGSTRMGRKQGHRCSSQFHDHPSRSYLRFCRTGALCSRAHRTRRGAAHDWRSGLRDLRGPWRRRFDPAVQSNPGMRPVR